MALWRKVLRSAVRGAGRTTGRVLSRHVLPDTVIPSWKTQQRISSTASGIWGIGSRLVKKQAKRIATNRAKVQNTQNKPRPAPRPAGAPYANRPALGPPAWEYQAALSRAKLVAKDEQNALARQNTPYKSAALGRVLRPVAAARSLARPSATLRGAARPAPSRSTPKKREYVDTETGEVFDRPGPGRTWADAPRKPSPNNPNAWQRGDRLRAPKEELKPVMKPARAYYMSGPTSVRPKKPRSVNQNSYNQLAERPSKFSY